MHAKKKNHFTLSRRTYLSMEAAEAALIFRLVISLDTAVFSDKAVWALGPAFESTPFDSELPFEVSFLLYHAGARDPGRGARWRGNASHMRSVNSFCGNYSQTESLLFLLLVLRAVENLCCCACVLVCQCVCASARLSIPPFSFVLCDFHVFCSLP